jgi:hypothetical protein
MIVFGEINVFPPDDAQAILGRARQALVEGGTLLLEPHRFGAVEQIGEQAPSWHVAETGFFSDSPHLWLEESTWNAEKAAAVQRFFVIDPATSEVTQYGQTVQAYTNEQYRSLLSSCGFPSVELHPTLGDTDGAFRAHLMAITAR